MRTIFKSVLLAVGSIALIGGAPLQAAGDAAEGEITFEGCAGCHGRPGYANTYPRFHVPRIAGQSGGYIVAALEAYVAGNRNHASMQGNALSLRKKDMENIAAYLAEFEPAQSSQTVVGNPKAGKKKAATCAACHGEKGLSNDPSYPHLAGQYESFLVHAMNGYKSGKRKNVIMAGMVSALSKEDILDIAAFYASQKKGLPILER